MEKLESQIKRDKFKRYYLNNSNHYLELEKNNKKLQIKYDFLFKSSTTGIAYHKIVYDTKGIPINYLITDINPQYEKILSIKREEVINKKATKVFNVEKAPYIDIYSKVAETQESFSFKTFFPPMNTFFKISVISPDKGEFITVFNDITESMNSKLKLLESEEKFRIITEQSFIGIAIFQDFKFMYVNQQFSNILGYSTDELLNWEPKEFFLHIYSEDKQMVEQIAQDKDFSTIGEIANLQFRVIKKSGEIIWLELISKTINYRGKLADLVITLNITEKIEAERIILEENKKLLELNKMRKDLITRVSHELKTPLTSIYGATQILLKHLKEKLDNDVINFVEILHRGALRLKKLIENLIDASRIETGKLELKISRQNLPKLIKECVEEMSYLTNRRNQSINMTLPEKLYLNIDKIRLQQVITNLLSNAIKNTPKNGKICVNIVEQRYFVDIQVEDNGIGITEKEKGILFEKFGKIERYGMDLGVDIEGSGLGLYISKEIIESHGGQILLESEGRHKGALFIVRLFKN